MQQSITNKSQAMLKMGAGSTLIEYTPSQPLPVQAGDIVGIMMPSKDAAMFSVRPLFLRLPEGELQYHQLYKTIGQ